MLIYFYCYKLIVFASILFLYYHIDKTNKEIYTSINIKKTINEQTDNQCIVYCIIESRDETRYRSTKRFV